MAVGGALDAGSAASDQCRRDVYALAAGLVAPALPPPLAKEQAAAAADTGRADKRDVATQLMPFSVEAAVKWGVLRAREGAVAAAVEWFVASASRFRALGEAGVLPATPLAVILELLAEFCDSVTAAHAHAMGADAAAVRARGRAAAVDMAREAASLDAANPKARATYARLSGYATAVRPPGGADSPGDGSAESCGTGTGAAGDGGRDGAFWFQLKSARVTTESLEAAAAEAESARLGATHGARAGTPGQGEQTKDPKRGKKTTRKTKQKKKKKKKG